MSIISSELLLGAAGSGGGYEIERSLRFNSSSDSRLRRTFSSTGNQKTWTWSGWVKGYFASGSQALFTVYNGGAYLIFGYQGFLRVENSAVGNVVTSAVYRDPAAWYHVVLAFDTTQAVGSDRVKIYVNGVRETTTGTDYTLNADYSVNTATEHTIGFYNSGGSTSRYLSGYLADVYFIDGQALDPSNFGEFDSNNVWQPIAYTGSFGSNGFYLPFTDNSSVAALGNDASGNSNDWTVQNVVLTGTKYGSVTDSPTSLSGQSDSGIGGEVKSNYAILNPAALSTTASIREGYLESQAQTTTYSIVGSTIGVSSGKWYWEVVTTNTTYPTFGRFIIGISEATGIGTNVSVGGDATSWGWISYNGEKQNNGVQTAYGPGYAINDIVGVALDCDNGTLTFYKNGVSQGVAFTGLTGKTLFPAVSSWTSNERLTINFGQYPFTQTAPSGFKCLCTANLPEPTIADGSTAMDVALYTGNGSTQTISGLNFSPDLVWTKGRSFAYSNNVFDTVRTATKRLTTDATNAEDTLSGVTAFNSDGFTLGSATGLNDNGVTYVAWTWDAGSSTVTNNDGSITSQVRANASAGFSIISYTYPASGTFTVGHGLGITPQFVILKIRNATTNWGVYHVSATSTNQNLVLNSLGPVSANTNYWGSSPFTSTTIGGGVGVSGVNGNNAIAYCFAPVAGYSSFGSYTGNGNANGPFVYTGFRPRWVLIKSSSNAQDWVLYDTERSPINAAAQPLVPNTSNTEPGSAWPIDIYSNGFKPRAGLTENNSSGWNYIYAAFAEHPFQSSRAR
jgi:hypothetical protein